MSHSLAVLVVAIASVHFAAAQTNCSCLSAQGGLVTVPMGTRIVTVTTAFGISTAIETLCPCSCSNCTCSSAANANIPVVSAYQPYYTCPITTTPAVTTTQSNLCSLPGSTSTFPPGTYVTGQLGNSSLSIIISCPCSCNNSYCSLQLSNAVPPLAATFQPYLLCSNSTTPATTTTTTTTATTSSTSQCMCATAANSSSYLPLGTYYSASFSLFGVSYTVQLTCGCACNCTCNTTYSNNTLASPVYIPYATCGNTSSTTAPTTTINPAYANCNFSLPGSNFSFPAGTYYTSPIPSLNQSVIITCSCNCSNATCAMQTVSGLLPNVFTPYALCSPSASTQSSVSTTTSVPNTSAQSCTCYSTANNSASALPLGTFLQSSFSMLGTNYSLTVLCGCSCGCICNTTVTAVSVAPPSIYTPYFACPNASSTVAPSTAYPIPSCNISLPGSNATFPAGTYYLNAVASLNISIIITCPCSCSANCSMQTYQQLLPSSYNPSLLCSVTTSNSTISTPQTSNSTYPGCNLTIPGSSASFPAGTYYVSAIASLNTSVIITCPCSCNASCSVQSYPQLLPSIYNPSFLCSVAANTSSPSVPQTSNATYPNCSVSLPGNNATFPIGTYYMSAIPTLNASLIIACPCSCNSTCSLQTYSLLLPNYYGPNVLCAIANVSSSSNATSNSSSNCSLSLPMSNVTFPAGTYYVNSIPSLNSSVIIACPCSCGANYTCSMQTVPQVLPSIYSSNLLCTVGSGNSNGTVSSGSGNYPNCSVSVPGSNVTFPIGSYYVSAIPALNQSVVITCPCSCGSNATCSMQIVNQLLQNTYTPYQMCSTSTTPTSACVCSAGGNLGTSLPIGTFYQSPVVTANANFTVTVSCPCQCGCTCNTTVTPNVTLPTIYQPGVSCPVTTTTPAPTPTTTLNPTCLVALPNSSVSFPAGTYLASPIYGLNISVIISCPCTCGGATCNVTTVSQYVTPVNQSNALCANSSTPTSTPLVTTSQPASNICHCLTAANSTSYVPPGTYLSTSITIGNTNYTIVLNCSCQCGCVCNTTTIANLYLPTVYQPYSSCPSTTVAPTTTPLSCYASLPSSNTMFPIGTIMSGNTMIQGASLGFLVSCPCSCNATCTLQNFTYALTPSYNPGALCSNVTTTPMPTTTYNPFISWNLPGNCSCSMGPTYNVPIGSYFQSYTQTSTTSVVIINGQSTTLQVNLCIQTVWSCPCNCSSCQCTYNTTNVDAQNCPGSISYPIVPYFYCPTSSTMTPTTSQSCLSLVYGNYVPLGSTVTINLPCFQINCVCGCNCSSVCPCSLLPSVCPSSAGAYNLSTTIVAGQCGSGNPTGRKKRSIEDQDAYSDAAATGKRLEYRASDLLSSDFSSNEHTIAASLLRRPSEIHFQQTERPMVERQSIVFTVSGGLDFLLSHNPTALPAALRESTQRILDFYIRALLHHTSLRDRVSSIGQFSLKRLAENENDNRLEVQLPLQLADHGEIGSDFGHECATAYQKLSSRYDLVMDPGTCTIKQQHNATL